MGKKFQGIEIRGTGLRITVHVHGQRYRQTLALEPTEANIRHAQKLRRVWISDLKKGATTSPTTFGAFAKLWLDGHDHIAKSTRDGYRKLLNRYWMPALWDRELHTITSTELKALVASYEWPSVKTRNNAISPLRMVFEAADDDEIIDRNPARRLKSMKHVSPLPDPFEQDEVTQILAQIKKRGEQYLNYFQFAFYSGLRTSEMIDLPWGNIDWRGRTILVNSAWVKGERKPPKTGKARTVEMHPLAREALTRQKAHTFLGQRNVFIDPITALPFVSDKPPRLVWDLALKLAQVRHRVAYTTRHTYATYLLMRGAKPMWVAQQLGHSTMEMTLRKYSKWIQGADRGQEMARVLESSGAFLGRFGGTGGDEGG